MNKNCIVIGGGVIGLCSAYYLHKEGCQVTIVDQSNMDAGASYVNAGFLSPSHIIPLAAPGVMKKGLKWLFNAESPLYIKPRFDIEFLKWAWAFNRSCNLKNVQKSIPVIKDMAVLSQDLYDDIKQNEKFAFHYEKKGLLMLCHSHKALDEEVKVLQIVKKEGLKAEVLTSEEVNKMEPNIDMNIVGAMYYECDYHTTPHEFMEEMKTYLKTVGVQFYKNENVKDIHIKNKKITSVITNKQKLKADEFVLTAGSWSSMLSKKIGLNLLLQAGKGYRINSYKNTNLKIPAILAEAKVAVTPMNGFTRFAGTMEIAGINQSINKTRVEAIANAVSKYYPEIVISKKEKEEVTSGLRPISPDGLPYIGKSEKCNNLTIATGHAMMGWSMATATGKLVSEIISGHKTSINAVNFNPDRKF
jgi:D-amino-acid dehydrogenase